MEAGSASIATPKGLESEVMGLPRDVATHIEVAGFTSSVPTCSTFTPYSNQHRGVNATFAQGDGAPGWHPLARGMVLYLHYLAPALSGDSQGC